ncbi:MAG: membrane protein insertion efficiency factor YidD [Eggerthellaceae bacterium]
MAKHSGIELIKQLPKTIALLLIKFYRLVISPLFPGCCRFVPTCSEYGMIAIQRYGFLKGSYLTFRRILRCRPGGGKGYDPVP